MNYLSTRISLMPLFFLSVLTSCASPISGAPVKDIFGVMSITPIEGFVDSSTNYRAQASSVRLPRDHGIRGLLMLQTNDEKKICKFREFRYRMSEPGYRWDQRKIAEDVANLFSNAVIRDTTKDFLKANIPVSAFLPNMNSTSTVSNSVVTLGSSSGWQSTRDHWAENNGQPRASWVLRSTTVVMRIPSQEKSGSPIYYLIAECSVMTKREKVEADMASVNAMLQTIQLYRPSLGS